MAEQSDQHTVMLVNGTFVGFSIILVGLFAGYIMNTPINKRIGTVVQRLIPLQLFYQETFLQIFSSPLLVQSCSSPRESWSCNTGTTAPLARLSASLQATVNLSESPKDRLPSSTEFSSWSTSSSRSEIRTCVPVVVWKLPVRISTPLNNSLINAYIKFIRIFAFPPSLQCGDKNYFCNKYKFSMDQNNNNQWKKEEKPETWKSLKYFKSVYQKMCQKMF